MIGSFKDLFVPADHGQNLSADKNVDRLLETLSDDELALVALENEVRGEFRALNEDVNRVRQKVDETLDKTAA